MPMLKTIKGGLADPAKGYTAAVVADYLNYGKTPMNDIADYLRNPKAGEEDESRVRAFAARNLGNAGPSDWAREMDSTRELAKQLRRDRRGHAEGERERLWYHFVISPDPRDHVGCDEVLEIATEWLEKMYPDAQATVTVHDDNKEHIPHAHIVVNAVLPETGRMIHRSKQTIIWEARWAQMIGENHGLSTLEDIVEWRKSRLPKQENVATKAEEAMRREGRWSWKEDIRDRIRMSVSKSGSWSQFVEEMEGAGYEVTEGRRGVCFHHPNAEGKERRVLGATLGSKWTKDAIIAEMAGTFSSSVGEGYDAQAFHEHMRGRKIPYEKLYKKGIRGRRSARPQNIDDFFGSITRNRANTRREIQTLLDVIPLVREAKKEERIVTRADVLEKLDTLAIDIVGLEDRVHETEAKFARAYDLLDAIDGLEGLQERLNSLPKGFWSKSVREERNGLEKALADSRKTIADALAQAAPWLAKEGYADATERQKAAHIIGFYRDQIAAEEAEVEKYTERARKLQKIQDVIDMTEPCNAEQREEYKRAQTATQMPPQKAIHTEAVASMARGTASSSVKDADEMRLRDDDVRRRRQEAEVELEKLQKSLQDKVKVPLGPTGDRPRLYAEEWVQTHGRSAEGPQSHRPWPSTRD